MGSKKKKTSRTTKKKTTKKKTRKSKPKTKVESKTKPVIKHLPPVEKTITPINSFGGYTNKPGGLAPTQQPFSNKEIRMQAAKELEVKAAKLVSKQKKVTASKTTTKKKSKTTKQEPTVVSSKEKPKPKAKTTKKKATKRPTTRQGRKDRIRAKKKTHKFTEKHISMIRSQKGKMSIREICKWFAKETHHVYKVSPGMVSLILNNKVHKPKEDKLSVYDLIEQAQEGKEVSEILGIDESDDVVTS